MKLILSRHYTPDSHWTKWTEEGFDFSEYSEPWKHPGVSSLAYETKATYGDLDYDGDSFLHQAVQHYWAPDISSRRGEINDNLVDMAKEFIAIGDSEKKFMSEDLGVDDIPQDWLDKSHYDKRGNGPAGSDCKHDRRIIIRYVRDCLQFKKETLWEQMVPLIIKENYAPKRDFLVRVVADDAWRDRVREWSDFAPDLLTDKYKEEFFKDPSIHFKEWAKSRSYHAAIITYPGENLLSYFHDEIVFQCYIQMIVEHNREKLDNYGLKIRVSQNPETEFVTSRRLLDRSETLTDDDFSILMELSHGWWS